MATGGRGPTSEEVAASQHASPGCGTRAGHLLGRGAAQSRKGLREGEGKTRPGRPKKRASEALAPGFSGHGASWDIRDGPQLLKEEKNSKSQRTGPGWMRLEHCSKDRPLEGNNRNELDFCLTSSFRTGTLCVCFTKCMTCE